MNFYISRNYFRLFFALILISGATGISQLRANPPQEDIEILYQKAKYDCPISDSCLFHIEKLLNASKEAEEWEIYFEATSDKLTRFIFFHQLDSLKNGLNQFDRDLAQFDPNSEITIHQAGNQFQRAQYHFLLKDFYSAIPFYKHAINILENIPNHSPQEKWLLVFAIQDLGTTYMRIGKYQEAIGEFAKAKEWILNSNEYEGRPSSYAATTEKKIGDIYLAQKELKAAERAYLRALAELNSFYAMDPNANKSNLIVIFLALGELYLELGDIEKAHKYFDQASPLPQPNSIYLARILEAKGKAFINEQHYNSARVNLEKALTIRGYSPDIKGARFAWGLNMLGAAYEHEGKLQEGLEKYQEALQNLSPSLNSNSPYANPTLDYTLDPVELLTTLRNKAQILSKLSENNQQKPEKLLNSAFECSQLAIRLVDSIRLNFDSEIDHQFLIEQSYPLFELAIKQAHQLHRATGNKVFLSKAFEISEKSRGLNLYFALQQTHVSAYIGIPRSFVEEERRLKAELTSIHNRLLRLEGKSSDKLTYWLNRRKAVKETYQNFIAEIENEYPQYFRLKYDLEVPTLEKVKSLAREEHRAFIEYFVGDKDIYAFVVTPETDTLINIPMNFPLIEWTDSLKLGITYYHESPADKRSEQAYLTSAKWYTYYAHALYDKLFKPIESSISLPQRVTVIPDKSLFYLPFSTLLSKSVSEAEAFLSHPYLSRQYIFSYSYSSGLLTNEYEKTWFRLPKTLAMAPFNQGQGFIVNSLSDTVYTLPTLTHTAAELERMATHFQTEILMGEEATKETFLSYAPNYQIIHLATHGILNDSLRPFLAFYQQKPQVLDSTSSSLLFLEELYQVVIPAELVVLNACNTGRGIYQLGEGVQSLGRGFSYAGVKSVLSTWWPIQDTRKTDILMGYLYEGLHDGLDKDKAFHLAQSNYLEAQTYDIDAHPFYWGGYMLTGELKPIPNPFRSFYPIIWGFLLVLVITSRYWSKLIRKT